jgi:hypothetical protein
MLVVAVVLAAGVFNAIALPGCASCHDKRGFGAATAAAAHAEIACKSCHVPRGVFDRMAFSLRQPITMLVPLVKSPDRDRAAVPDTRCVSCHQEVAGGVMATKGLRINHATCAVGSACSDCHSTTAHGEATTWVRAYSMDQCLTCHASEGQTGCDLCHEGRRPTSRVQAGSFAVTHGPQWQSTHGMGDAATCMACHTQDDCAECHGAGVPHTADFIKTHPASAKNDNAKCDGCHETSFCDSCHATPMPHTSEFVSTHPKTAEQQAALCDRCHADSDCTECHEKHVHPGGAIGSSTSEGGDQ